MLKLYNTLVLLLPFIPTVIGNFTNAFEPKVVKVPNGAYTGYFQGAVCQPQFATEYPKTVDEVVAIVKQAIKNNTTVKALGSRHSTTDIICTDGIPVDMRAFQDFSLNDDNSATVGAGMTLRDCTTKLRGFGRALKTTPAYGNLTIAGTIATGAHGSTLKYGSSISSQVLAMTIVDGHGAVRKITSEDDLKAFRIHLGLLGIVLDVTLITVPLFKTRGFCYPVSDDILFNGQVIDIARNTDRLNVHWFPRLDMVVICNWTNVDVNTPGEAITAALLPPTSSTFNQYVVPTLEIFQTLCSVEAMQTLEPITFLTLFTPVPDFQPIYSVNRTFQNPAVGYYDVMLSPTCQDTGDLQCPWNHTTNGLDILDNEIVVPLDRIAEYCKSVEDIIYKYPAAFPFDGFVLRFSEKSDIYMANSFGRDACHFEFYMIKRKNPYDDPSIGLAAYQAIMQLLANNFTGKGHWGKCGLHYVSQERITQKLDPEARDSFIEVMKRYDPNEIFLNSFGRRIKYKNATKIDTDPAVKHCALLDNCICQKNSDCADHQICTRIKGYPNFPVCKYAPYHRCQPTTAILIQITITVIPKHIESRYYVYLVSVQ